MGDDGMETAEGHGYRRRSALEAAGGAVARWLPADGGVRRALRAAYHAALGPRTATLPDGERFRVLPAWRHLSWNPVEVAAFRAAARPGMTALDVGANVGAYALLFGRWAGAGGRVYAFEPAPAAWEGLRRHVALNGLTEVVTPVRAAVSDRGGRAALVGADWQGTSRLGDDGEGGPMVDTVTIDEFCARHDCVPDVVKIDVEGWELEALRGARETIARGGDRLALFVEMHPTAWRERGVGADEVRAELAAQGLRAEPLRPVADTWSLEGECLRLTRAR